MSSEDVDPPQATPDFSRLPMEILQDISEILDTIHPASLLAFACASKKCHAVASVLLFRTVKIAIPPGKEPLHNLHAWEERLRRDDAFAHVRRLILISSPQKPAGYPYMSLDPWERGRENDTGLWSCWDSCLDRWLWGMSPRQMEPIPDHKWGSVIDLVGQLKGLVDIFWACLGRFPPRLLQTLQTLHERPQTLHERPKFCRLHHYTFNSDNLTQTSLNPYEDPLITSPCLHSIGDLCTADGAMIPPFGKDIQSHHESRRLHLGSRSNRIRHNVKWVVRPLPLESIHPSSPGTSRPIHSSVVLNEAYGKFPALRVLKLNTILPSQGLPASSNLSSLVELTFTCPTARHYSVPQAYWDEAIALFRNLPNLTTLRIRDWNREISIVPGLGPSLETLELRTCPIPGGPPLLDDHIHQLAYLCPRLENLTIEVQRSRGDISEIARYRSLGRLPRLRVLELCLDASPAPILADFDTAIEPWFDEKDTKYLPAIFALSYRQGHVRDVFLNSAIDEVLARTIFAVIDGAKPRHSGRAPLLPLERLELYAWGGASFPRWDYEDYIQFHHLLAALRQVWVVEPDTREDRRGMPRVDEIYWNANKSFLRNRHLDHVEKHGYWFELWRRVWPAEREGVDWWDDWKSRPLDSRLEMDAGGSIV